MKHCPGCQRVNNENAKFCEYCGYRLQKEGGNTYSTLRNNNILKNIIVGVVTIFAISISIIINFSTDLKIIATEKKLTSEEYGFEIIFPSNPKIKKKEDGVQYTSFIGSEVYLLRTFDLDINPSDFDKKTSLNDFFDIIKSGKTITVDSLNYTTRKAYDSLEFTGSFSTPFLYFWNETAYVKGLLLIRDDFPKVKIYGIMVSSTNKSEYLNKYKKFISSLNFIK